MKLLPAILGFFWSCCSLYCMEDGASPVPTRRPNSDQVVRRRSSSGSDLEKLAQSGAFNPRGIKTHRSASVPANIHNSAESPRTSAQQKLLVGLGNGKEIIGQKKLLRIAAVLANVKLNDREKVEEITRLVKGDPIKDAHERYLRRLPAARRAEAHLRNRSDDSPPEYEIAGPVRSSSELTFIEKDVE